MGGVRCLERGLRMGMFHHVVFHMALVQVGFQSIRNSHGFLQLAMSETVTCRQMSQVTLHYYYRTGRKPILT